MLHDEDMITRNDIRMMIAMRETEKSKEEWHDFFVNGKSNGKRNT